MSKKSNLIHAYTRALKTSNKGAYATRQDQIRIMHLIVANLFALRCAPHCWQKISKEQIQKLSEYWKDECLNAATIKNRMSVLRYTAGC